MRATAYDARAVSREFADLRTGLELALSAVTNLSQLFSHEEEGTLAFDPKDPANKYNVGGADKLTPRGVEICYRLFDEGKTRYAVSQLMGISFGGATHRYHAWKKAGGIDRERQNLADL